MAIQLWARGPWEVKAPYVVEEKLNYTCIGIRGIRELEAEGLSVFDKVYFPVGLTQEDCDTDRVNAVSIIVLEAEGRNNLFIPSSYITSFPTAVQEGFSRVVLALDVGILSDKVPLDYLKQRMQQAAQDITGQENANVELFLAPYSGVITPAQAELMEQNRQALIKNGTNHYAENKRLTDELNLEREKVARLEKIIIQHAIPTA